MISVQRTSAIGFLRLTASGSAVVHLLDGLRQALKRRSDSRQCSNLSRGRLVIDPRPRLVFQHLGCQHHPLRLPVRRTCVRPIGAVPSGRITARSSSAQRRHAPDPSPTEPLAAPSRHADCANETARVPMIPRDPNHTPQPARQRGSRRRVARLSAGAHPQERGVRPRVVSTRAAPRLHRPSSLSKRSCDEHAVVNRRVARDAAGRRRRLCRGRALCSGKSFRLTSPSP